MSRNFSLLFWNRCQNQLYPLPIVVIDANDAPTNFNRRDQFLVNDVCSIDSYEGSFIENLWNVSQYMVKTGLSN